MTYQTESLVGGALLGILSGASLYAVLSTQKRAVDDAIGKLVGAKVQPIDLNTDVARIQGPKPTVTSAGTYTMYPQAADRVQAATNIAANTNTGRSLDIRG